MIEAGSLRNAIRVLLRVAIALGVGLALVLPAATVRAECRTQTDGIGGTGIVGIVTGFGSVCVNGLEVAYDDLTAIDSNGAADSPVDLAVGQLVVVEATGRGDRLRAERIAARDAAVGPVFEIDPVRGALVVLGQDVRVGPDVPLGDRSRSPTLRSAISSR